MAGSNSSSNGIKVAPSRSFFRQRDLRWLFHVAAALYFVRVWVWHVSIESAHRRTRTLFGGYFRYLTICSFTVQVVQLTLATLVDLTPFVLRNVRFDFEIGGRLRLKRVADDLSCCVFVLANCVTLLYYVIEFLMPGGVISRTMGIPVLWIDLSTHVLNSLVAWIDVTVCHPRRFGSRAFWMTAVFAACYGCWMYFIRYKTGVYPYGFLNKLPHPYGFGGMILVAGLLMAAFFYLGKAVSYLTRNVMAADKVENFDRIGRQKKTEDLREAKAECKAE